MKITYIPISILFVYLLCFARENKIKVHFYDFEIYEVFLRMTGTNGGPRLGTHIQRYLSPGCFCLLSAQTSSDAPP